jgi:uncharacterized repeat protein (TIGR02543 family)
VRTSVSDGKSNLSGKRVSHGMTFARFALSAVLAASSVGAGAIVVAPTAIAAADNVPCVDAGSLYSSAQNGVLSSFKYQDPSSTPVTTLGTAVNIKYNAIGWNAADGYFYGVAKSGTGITGPEVVKITNTGQATVLSTQPTDASGWPTVFNNDPSSAGVDIAAGDVIGGVLYALDIRRLQLWAIPLSNPSSATKVTLNASFWDVTNTQGGWPSDIVVSGGIAYGVLGFNNPNSANRGQLVAMNVSTGATELRSLSWVGQSQVGETGAVYRGWNGDMFVTFNGSTTRNLYRVTNFTTSPVVTLARTVAVNLTDQVDGTSTPITDCTLITYNANGGGTGTTDPTPGTATEPVTVASTAFTPLSGQVFLGWATDPNATAPNSTYDPGDSITMPAGGLTLYAIWQQTITYNANGATGSVSSTMGATGASVTIAGSTGLTAPDGHTFLGWSTDPNALTPDPNYDAGDSIAMPSGGLTLYAVWDPPLVTSVVYNANGGTGTMSPTSGSVGTDVTLAANSFSNTTEFLGWGTDPAGPVAYASGDPFTLVAGGSTLYAIWATPPAPEITWTLSYDGNSGTCDAPSQTAPDTTWVNTHGSTSCTRQGYVFTGWNTSTDGSGLGFAPGDATQLTGDNTLYAQWQPIRVEATDDSVATQTNTPVTSSVVGNDVVPSGATFAITSSPSNGTATMNPDGSYTYTPRAGFVGVDSFTYTVCGAGGSPCATATVSITVVGSPIPPIVTPPDATVTETVAVPGSTIPGSVFSIVTPPQNGVVDMKPFGEFTYTPNQGFVGTDSFVYEQCVPGNAACSTGTVTITVSDASGLRAAPQLKLVNGTTTSPVVFTPRVPVAGGSIQISQAGQSAWSGRVAVPGKGIWVVRNGEVLFTADASFYGRVTIRYRVIAPDGTATYSTFTAVRTAMPGIIDGGR